MSLFEKLQAKFSIIYFYGYVVVLLSQRFMEKLLEKNQQRILNFAVISLAHLYIRYDYEMIKIERSSINIKIFYSGCRRSLKQINLVSVLAGMEMKQELPPHVLAQVHFNINYLDNTIVNNKLSALAKLFYRTISYLVYDLWTAGKRTMVVALGGALV